MSFDPEHNSLALDPNAAKAYALPYVEVWGPNGEYEPKMRWDRARDLLRFGTIHKESGEKRKWTRVDPKSMPKPRTVEDDVKQAAAEQAIAKKGETNGKLDGLRMAAKLLGIDVEPTWGIKRIETEIKNMKAALASGRAAPGLQAPAEGLADGEHDPVDDGVDGTHVIVPTEGLE